MLADPKEVHARAGIREVHFLPFNPVDKHTAITFIDESGRWHRATKGAPEEILHLAKNKDQIAARVHSVIDKFAERGLRSLAVARQEVPEKSKDDPVVRGNSLASCLSSTHLVMTVRRPSVRL
ncbi:hypothetical protein Mapa_001070 [Marchantia paleacea]|nr:hypothetical protein Mapa_001070 [Marchantia paleacea]